MSHTKLCIVEQNQFKGFDFFVLVTTLLLAKPNRNVGFVAFVEMADALCVPPVPVPLMDDHACAT